MVGALRSLELARQCKYKWHEPLFVWGNHDVVCAHCTVQARVLDPRDGFGGQVGRSSGRHGTCTGPNHVLGGSYQRLAREAG